jgi:serine protease Do
MSGEVIGMSTAILSRSGGSQGIGFAIPSNMAQRILMALREEGKVERAWLGVQIQDLNQAMAEYYGQDRPQGVLISAVNENTPAERAGLQEGDIVLAVDDKPVDRVSNLRNLISLSPVGRDVQLRVLREGNERSITVELEAMPDQERLARHSPEEVDDGITGVTVRELSEEIRRRTDLPENIDGVVVVDIEPACNAAREGLQVGDVILEIGKQEVANLQAYQRLAGRDQDKPILLRVYKQRGGRIFMAIPR